MTTKELLKKIEQITKARLAKEKVVSLKEYRELRSPMEPRSLLVIEDDESLRRAFETILTRDGHRVIAVADGTQLSKVLDGESIDLIILDVGLPWINGYELAALMKASRDLKHIPIIFVSGRGNKEDIKKGFEVGADDYITKPFEVDEVRNSVRTLLKLTLD